MKLKLSVITVLAALALGYQAQAAPSTTLVSSKLTVSIVVKTNGSSFIVSSNANGTTRKWPVGTAKFSNKDLLALFQRSEFASNTFPAGAQLVVGWDWDGQVLVVDKTGTNVLYAVPTSGPASFHLTDYYEDGDYTETLNNREPGSATWDEDYMMHIWLEDDAIGLDLWGYPTAHQHFMQNWDSHGTFSTWNDSEVIHLDGGLGGDQGINDNSQGSVVGGAISITGHGSGLNSYWFGI